ncbi:phage Gp37/Gp68 family protein [Streptomyces sp. ISL-94]|nr:phage Gp37/Gp68 family protein [Streptomyces sp. ISL-94]MBT2477603.1 phage Gp37/Gp68 family protein [Streptomyces sp. ISL-94]
MSNIEWTEQTWNPTTGCDKISPGCDNCYALTMAKRLKAMGQAKYQTDGNPATSGPGFGVAMHDDVLTEPLRWTKPRRVFVNSMSDLFHADVTDEFIARVFAVMAATPQHTYQILTKRHGRMRSLVGAAIDGGQRLLEATPDEDTAQALYDATWPLPNVWLGVSVEDQKRADLRIPALIDTSAAVRFLSCEPLLGPVDLTPWLTPISPLLPEQASASWADWTWPEWVPAIVREHIERFWGADQGRSPRDWMRDMHQQQAPAFGARVTMDDGFGADPKQTTGRYVHAWNNIGRLVRDDGTFAYTSFGYARDRTELPIDWVIVGGESGPGARPVNPDWVAGLSATAQAAGAATFVKQLGSVWATANSASDRKGGTPEDWPAELQVRQYPASVKAGQR